jgi:hypothetical protein
VLATGLCYRRTDTMFKVNFTLEEATEAQRGSRFTGVLISP